MKWKDTKNHAKLCLSKEDTDTDLICFGDMNR